MNSDKLAKYRLGKKRILVVDDSEQIRQSLERLLRSENYDVLLATNGQEALAMIECKAVDLILLDLAMPGLSGWETLRRLSDFSPPVPVVVMTGHAQQRTWVESLGARALFEKPLDPAGILQTIHEVLRDQSPSNEWELAPENRFRWHPGRAIQDSAAKRNWGINE